MATFKIGSSNGPKARRQTRRIIEVAVQKSRVPGSPSPGTTSGSPTYISPDIDGDNYVDENGNLIRPFMLGVDALGDAHRPLCVKGKRYRYYG